MGCESEESRMETDVCGLPESGTGRGKARVKGRVVAELEIVKGVVLIYEEADAEVVY